MIFEVLATADDETLIVSMDVDTFNNIMKEIVVQALRTPYTKEEDE